MRKKEDPAPTFKELTKIVEDNSRKLGELAEQQKKTADQVKKTADQVKETSAEVKKTSTEMKKTVTQTEKTSAVVAQVSKQIGGIDRIFGEMAEFVSFSNLTELLLKQAGIRIGGVAKRFKRAHAGQDYEIDLIAVGAGVVVVIEVKTTLRSKDIKKLADIMPNFTAVFPEYGDMDVYGGLAYMKAHDGTEEQAQKHGFLTIRAIGSSSQLVGFNKTKLRNFRCAR